MCIPSPLGTCLEAAAAAGRVDMCRRLLQLFPDDRGNVLCDELDDAVSAASAAGHRHVVKLLVDACRAVRGWAGPDLCAAARAGSPELGRESLRLGSFSCLEDAIATAASQGDEAMVEWLLQQQGQPWACARGLEWVVAYDVAEGCSLPYLQHVLTEWYIPDKEDGGSEELVAAPAGTVTRWQVDGGGGGSRGNRRSVGRWREGLEAAVQGAVGSPMSDWRNKLEWLLLQQQGQEGLDISADLLLGAFLVAVRRTDAAARLRWLAGRGFPVASSEVACEAVAQGRTEAVVYLVDELGVELGVELEQEWVAKDMQEAARNGHLSVLQALHQRGYELSSSMVEAAVRGGHVEVVEWVLSVLPGPAPDQLPADAFVYAVLGEDWPMLELLLLVGCPLPSERELMEAAKPSEETVAWLAERGCSYQHCTVGDAGMRCYLCGAGPHAEVCCQRAFC